MVGFLLAFSCLTLSLIHISYVLGGIKELPSIRSRHVRFLLDHETVLEDDYICLLYTSAGHVQARLVDDNGLDLRHLMGTEQAERAEARRRAAVFVAVSYTHLDVYKRQAPAIA